MKRLRQHVSWTRRRVRAHGRRLIAPIEQRVGPALGYRFGSAQLDAVSEQGVREAGYHSQIGQDLLLDRHVFRGMRNGVFVDVGAHDGVSGSNTLFFEQSRGWTGVCLEPNPDVFTSLTSHRSATCMQAAIGSQPGLQPFRIVSSASMLSGLVAKYDRRHLDRVDSVDSESSRSGTGSRVENVEVQRLDTVLREAGIDRVDLLSIDVEGAESDVLGSIRLAEFNVRAVIIENNFRSWKIARILQQQGYQLIVRLGWDELYLPAPTSLRTERPMPAMD